MKNSKLIITLLLSLGMTFGVVAQTANDAKNAKDAKNTIDKNDAKNAKDVKPAPTKDTPAKDAPKDAPAKK
ncbi:MAG TPA: hypothetical protein PLX69_19675 [Leptospiraceae bacterium]|nr:hypothetical protein [Leptospiraceae bacterium]HRG76791.1 hypothetical protein [Leptospiraceae bacterium]